MAPEAALSLLLGQAVDDIRRDLDDPHSDTSNAVGLHVATIITVQVIYLDHIFLLLSHFTSGRPLHVLSWPIPSGFS